MYMVQLDPHSQYKLNSRGPAAPAAHAAAGPGLPSVLGARRGAESFDYIEQIENISKKRTTAASDQNLPIF
jgi:hypothetical protein